MNTVYEKPRPPLSLGARARAGAILCHRHSAPHVVVVSRFSRLKKEKKTQPHVGRGRARPRVAKLGHVWPSLATRGNSATRGLPWPRVGNIRPGLVATRGRAWPRVALQPRVAFIGHAWLCSFFAFFGHTSQPGVVVLSSLLLQPRVATSGSGTWFSTLSSLYATRG